MLRCRLLALSALSACGDPSPNAPSAPWADAPSDGLAWAAVDDLGQRALGLASNGSATWALVDGAVLESTDDGTSWTTLPETGLPAGERLWIGTGGGVLLVEVDGTGLMRWTGAEWVAPSQPPVSTLMSSFNPRARPVPSGAGGDATAWLATAGGLFSSTNDGDTWNPVAISPDAGINLLFNDLAFHDDTVLAGATLPAGLLPADYADLLSGVLFRSDDGGQTWIDAAPDLPFRYATGVAFDAAGTPWVAALDGGLFGEIGGEWLPFGGPNDTLDVSVEGDGVSVISATRGVWRHTAQGWQGAGTGPMVGLTERLALGLDGSLYRLDEHPADAGPPEGNATVHIALSFHVNLYHSYRGDSNTDDGYGIDLDVMRNTLDWLDRHPRARADWDYETHFSLGDWMQTDGADVLARVQGRVDAGVDEVRPMSWNNGAMANHTESELKLSMTRSMDDLDATFGKHVPGVQPQECMFTADHITWYRDVGIEWATLFYSGTPFTALRSDIELPKEAWYNPFSLTDPDDPTRALTTIPVYHHADMVNHGGLAGWATQVHENHSEDQLLVIHFDADAESWESFESELAAVEALDFVQFTLLSDYVASHPPALSVPLPGDVADGTGDGFQSWAEKDFNHRLATTIHQAREASVRAESLRSTLDAVDQAAVQSHLQRAMDARLLALSTTHFGLAAPVLHPDRIESATQFAETALSEAQAALDIASSAGVPAAGMVMVHNPHDVTGMALLDFTVGVPAEIWQAQGASGVWVARDGVPQPIGVTVQDDGVDPVQVGIRLVQTVEERSSLALTWGADGTYGPVSGMIDDPVSADLPLLAPFSECDGVRSGDFAATELPPTTDARSVMQSHTTRWDFGLCGQVADSAVTWTLETWYDLPGTILDVHAQLPDATGGTGTEASPWNLDAESIALSPLACNGTADSLTWRTFGGTTRTRPVRQGQSTWNGQAIDAWMTLQCADGQQLQVAHDAMTRTSLAMAPLRTSEANALLAPLGTLWGSPIRHDVRRTGGQGAGDIITAVVGSQFRPAAPDWSSREVHYRLLIGTNGQVDEGTMTLFAHPPLVLVGPHPAATDGDTGDARDTGTPVEDTGSTGDTGPPGDTGTETPTP